MLDFSFNVSEIKRIADEFGASERDLRFAYSRALRRTAQTMKARARKGLREELDLRTAGELRRRLHGFRFKKGSGLGEVRMWFGLNDMKVSAFKGRPRKTAAGASYGNQSFDGAFVARNRKGKRTVMRRVSGRAWPIREEVMPIQDKAQIFVEDEIFDQIEEVFFRHFLAEVRARTIYQVGNKHGA